MRLTLLNQFYPPDLAPTGRYLQDLASVLGDRGHDVRVICSRAAYAGGIVPADGSARPGVRVTRLPGLGLGGRGIGRVAEHALYFAGAVAAGLFAPRPDVVLALTTPPYLGVAARVIARLRGAAHAHWIMDVYPDAVAAHGLLGREGWAWRFFERLARWQWADAGAMIALGPRMMRLMQRYVREPGRLEWVALWVPRDSEPGSERADADARAMRARRGWSDDDLVLLCSGHLGRAHLFQDFLEAAARMGANGTVWAFVGRGGRLPELERFARAHPAARVALHPPVELHELGASLAAGDVHLVGVAPGWDGVVVPSRLQAAFAVGRPVIFVGPPDCEVAEWVRESGGGWVVPPGDVAGLMASVEEARDAATRAARGAAAREYARQRFDRGRNCARVADLVESAAKAVGGTAP